VNHRGSMEGHRVSWRVMEGHGGSWRVMECDITVDGEHGVADIGAYRVKLFSDIKVLKVFP